MITNRFRYSVINLTVNEMIKQKEKKMIEKTKTEKRG